MTLVDHEQKITREVIEQRPRGFTFLPHIEMTAVIFDSGGIPHFTQHL